MIGKSVPRVDAYEKVTGRAKFTEDLIPPRCLVGALLSDTGTSMVSRTGAPGCGRPESSYGTCPLLW